MAAMLLKEAGHRVIGVTLGLWSPTQNDMHNPCCSPETVDRAKAVADHLGIPHYAIDQRAEFRDLVVDYFVREYSEGRTPNPCVKCNARVRFGALLDVAAQLGANRIATGHYARLRGTPPRLARGVDSVKDQSYVLAEVRPEQLERCIFPLGPYTKAEVRRMASTAGLEPIVAGESQEICFVPHDDYRAFLRDTLGDRPGVVVDESGRELATHTGTYNFTVGQRKGLGIGGGNAMYVARVDAESGQVVVASAPDTATEAVFYSCEVLHRRRPRKRVLAQIRSMAWPVEGRLAAGEAFVPDVPVSGVAPGQTIAVYDGDDVVLGATITAAGSSASLGVGALARVRQRAYAIVKRLSAR